MKITKFLKFSKSLKGSFRTLETESVVSSREGGKACFATFVELKIRILCSNEDGR